MDRTGVMLAALAAGGENASFTPVQVQKLFFLIDREIAPLIGGPYFNFQPYDYGPFDWAVYETLASLSSQGLVRIQHTERYRIYSLTTEGYRRGIQLLHRFDSDAQQFICQAAVWVRSLNFQQLVSAIYKRYPDMKENSVFR